MEKRQSTSGARLMTRQEGLELHRYLQFLISLDIDPDDPNHYEQLEKKLEENPCLQRPFL